MCCRFISIVFVLIGSSAFASEEKNMFFFGESVIQYREDKLRERVNENETSITNISIVAQKNMDKNKSIRVELLGEESRVTDEFNLTIGELFYKQTLSFEESTYLNFNYTVGFMKLRHGILNPIDGNFSQLPNYYQFLYGLPRGIDVGGVFEKKITEKISLGFGGYLGQTVRDSDGFQAEAEGLPYTLHFSYSPFETLELNAHYYQREFANSPEIRGFGFDLRSLFRYKSLNLYLNAETWSIDSISVQNNSNGFIYLINPKVEFKGVYLEGFYSNESWNFKDDSTQVNEQFISHRLGYKISKYFILETEYLTIENSDLQSNKEEAFQARAYFNWEL